MAEIHWFPAREGFLRAIDALQDAIAEHDIPIAAATTTPGHCTACDRETVFEVNTGAMFGDRPNLREGLRCVHCGLSARQRLVLLAMQAEIDKLSSPLHGAMLEQTTRLYHIAHGRWRWLGGSEYLGEHHASGRHYWWSTHWWRWRHTRHESITAFSHTSESLALLVHSDVLEHVYDTALALRECARVLRKGGVMLFTVPFFAARSTSVLRGRPGGNGQIEHLQPPEYHGDGMARGNIYTFHNFGWDFFELLRRSDFSRVEIGLCHAPSEGLCCSDPAGEQTWRMLPLLFRAVK